jgi:hypothetical protein
MTKENQVCSFHHHVNALFLVCCCLSIDCMMQHARRRPSIHSMHDGLTSMQSCSQTCAVLPSIMFCSPAVNDVLPLRQYRVHLRRARCVFGSCCKWQMKYSAFYWHHCLIDCLQQSTLLVNNAPSCGGTLMLSCNYSVVRRLCRRTAYSNKQCTPPPEGEASPSDRIALQEEYVPQQVMCVTFTNMSMSAVPPL